MQEIRKVLPDIRKYSLYIGVYFAGYIATDLYFYNETYKMYPKPKNIDYKTFHRDNDYINRGIAIFWPNLIISKLVSSVCEVCEKIGEKKSKFVFDILNRNKN